MVNVFLGSCEFSIFFLFCFQRLSNGSIDPDSDVKRVIELQETVEKQNSELTNTRTKMLELNNKFTEVEENYTTAQKDLIKAQEQVVKLQRDLREVNVF
jgi:septal ring factor EnvC (AmiA/AmiB activator)